MGGCIPERACGLHLGLLGGEADVAQEVVVQMGEGAALAVQGHEAEQAGQEPKAGGGAGRAGGDAAGHGGFFHVMW